MTAIQSTPGILVIYPPQIPGATTPVISDPPSAPGTALIGLPQSIFTQTATRDGTLAAAVKVRIDPPAHDGKGYDAISLWLDGVRLESKPIPPSDWDKVTFFDLFESLLRDGRINTLTYKIHRASENERESLPLLILYSRELPGGNDVPGTGDHPGLDISLPAELGDPPHIGKDEVNKGVPVTLLYPFMKAYDAITLELNRERFTFTLQPGEEGKPYVITITRAMFEQASSHPQFPISYTVVDQLNNPTHKRRWSRIIKTDVDLERVTLTAPDLSEGPGDPTDDPDTIDLGKLKESLYVRVHVLSPPWVADDTLRVSYTCTPPTGPVVTHTTELTVKRLPDFPQLEVPAAKVLPDSQVQAIYEQIRGGKIIGTSKPATARVIGEGLPNLLPPRLIKSDNGVLNPLDPANLQGANGQVEVLGFRAGDTVRLIVKGAPGAGSPTFAAKPLNVNSRANFALSNAFIAANMGKKKLEFIYVLIRGGRSFPSPALTATVGTIPDNHPSLSTPAMDGAIGKELDVTKMQASDQLRVGEWPQQVSGQCVWLRYDGFDTNGVAIFFEDCKGEPHTALPGLIRPAPLDWLKTLKDGSALTISFRVNFDGVANAATAVAFPLRNYTVKAVTLIAPTLSKVLDADNNEILEAGTTNSTVLKLQGKASNGQQVEIFDGSGESAISKGTATANATGDWELSITVTLGARRLYAQSLYHSSPVYSNVRTLTVLHDFIVDTSPLNLSGSNYIVDITAFGWTRTDDDPDGTAATRTASGGLSPYTYTTSNPAVASVTPQGRIRSEGNGTATITVRDASAQTKTFNVTASNVRTIIKSPTIIIGYASALAWIQANGDKLPATNDHPLFRILSIKYRPPLYETQHTGHRVKDGIWDADSFLYSNPDPSNTPPQTIKNYWQVVGNTYPASAVAIAK